MKDENTILDDKKKNAEETLFEENHKDYSGENTVLIVKDGKKPKWVKLAGGAGAGVLIGAAAVLFGSASTEYANDNNGAKDNKPADDKSAKNETVADGSSSTSTDNVAVESVVQDNTDSHLATGVSDDMSFGEAFASARHELGPGGAFVWHGNVYGTYYAEEWNNMSAEQQSDYYDKVASTTFSHDNSELEVLSVDDDVKSNDMVANVDDSAEVEVLGVESTHNGDEYTETVTAHVEDAVLVEVELGGDDGVLTQYNDMNMWNTASTNEVSCDFLPDVDAGL